MGEQIHIQCESSVVADQGDLLLSHVVKAWIAGVPDGASIEAITKEVGSQRDPITVTAGLTAKWSEIR